MHKKIHLWIGLLLFLASCNYPALAPAQPGRATLPLALTVDATNAEGMPIATLTATANVDAPEPTATIIPEPAGPMHGVFIKDFVPVAEDALLQQERVEWSRFDKFHWDVIEPTNLAASEYDWSLVDEADLLVANDSGVEVIATILFTPEWAQKYPGIACGPIAEGALAEFADFMQALVSRYSQPPYNVKYWELGNEPDVAYNGVPPRIGFGCWGEPEDNYFGGAYYAEMLRVVYPRIKAADPEAQVLIGGLLLDCDPVNPPETQPGSGEVKNCTPSRFLDGILNNGGGDYFDGISFHAYDYYAATPGKYSNINWHGAWDTTGPILIPKTRFIRSVLSAYGHGGKYLINTEVALICGRDGSEDYCRAEEFELTKAYYLAQAFAAARAEGLRANIWYSLNGWRGSQLVDENQQPNLAYQAYGFSAELLDDAAYAGEISAYPSVRGYQFVTDEARIWLLSALDDGTHAVHLDEQPSAIYDVLGNAFPTSQDINVTLAPVYIYWGD
jgi:hypothetical protein